MARVVRAFTLMPGTVIAVENVSTSREFTAQLDTFFIDEEPSLAVDNRNLTDEDRKEIAKILRWSGPVTDAYELINTVGGEGTTDGSECAKAATDYLRAAFKKNRVALAAQEQRRKNNSTYGNMSRTLEALVLLGVRSLKNADVSGSQESNAGKAANKPVNVRTRKTVAA